MIGEKEAAPGGEAQYWVVKYSKGENEVSQEEKNGIRWAVKVDGGIRELKDKNGSHITLEIKNDWAGKEIAVMACVEGFNENVCQKTMVGKAGIKLKVTEMYWMDCNERNKIDTIKKGQTAILYVKTNNFNPGEAVTISFVNDKTGNEFTLSGMVDAQGLAKIKWDYEQLI